MLGRPLRSTAALTAAVQKKPAALTGHQRSFSVQEVRHARRVRRAIWSTPPAGCSKLVQLSRDPERDCGAKFPSGDWIVSGCAACQGAERLTGDGGKSGVGADILRKRECDHGRKCRAVKLAKWWGIRQCSWRATTSGPQQMPQPNDLTQRKALHSKGQAMVMSRGISAASRRMGSWSCWIERRT